jgi:hypothetical protein
MYLIQQKAFDIASRLQKAGDKREKRFARVFVVWSRFTNIR